MSTALRRAADATDQLVVRAATGITRRRFLRNAGSAALGISLGSAYFLSRTRVADAFGSCSTHPCGPSPLCVGTCNGYLCWSCYRRPYEGSTCASPTTPNCWTETCTSGTWQGKWNCCDCCCPNQGGNSCSGCPNSTYRKCICRKKIG